MTPISRATVLPKARDIARPGIHAYFWNTRYGPICSPVASSMYRSTRPSLESIRCLSSLDSGLWSCVSTADAYAPAPLS